MSGCFNNFLPGKLD